MGPGIFDLLIYRLSDAIEKAKKYLKPGQHPPHGVILRNGPRNGKYYLTEDRHTTVDGQHHKLIRGESINKDEMEHTRKKYLILGAKSVEFFRKPNDEKDLNGNPLHSVYVNWGESTQKEVEAKKEADKERYANRRLKDYPDTGWKENAGTHSKKFYRHSEEGEDGHPRYMDHGHLEIKPSGTFGAKLFHVDKEGNSRKIALSYEPVFGEESDTQIDIDRSRQKNVDHLKAGAKEIQTLGPHYLNMLADNQARLDQERAEREAAGTKRRPRAPAKNPIWDLKQALKQMRERKIPLDDLIPEPTPAPISEPPKPVVKEKSFRQDEVFLDPEKAEKHRGELEKKGFEAEVRKKKIGKGEFHAVYFRKKEASVVPKDEQHPVFPVSKKAFSHVQAMGKKIKDQSFETLIAIDDRGDKRFYKDGQESSVTVQLEDKPKFNNARVIHNHPSTPSLSFSFPDLKFAMNNKISEMYVFGRDGTIFLAMPPAGEKHFGEKSDIQKMLPMLEQAENETRDNLIKRLDNSEITINQANRLHSDVVSKLLHSRGAIRYYVDTSGRNGGIL